MLGRSPALRAADKSLPPGALLTFLQKGLQYVGIEESLYQDSSNNASRGELSSSKRNNNNAANANSNNNYDEAGDADASTADFSILSTVAVQAICRKNPPVQLNVPPAAAAAAVKARLECQAKLQAEQQKAAAASAAAAAAAIANPAGHRANGIALQQSATPPPHIVTSTGVNVGNVNHHANVAGVNHHAMTRQLAQAGLHRMLQQQGGQQQQLPAVLQQPMGVALQEQQRQQLLALQQQRQNVAAVSQRLPQSHTGHTPPTVPQQHHVSADTDAAATLASVAVTVGSKRGASASGGPSGPKRGPKKHKVNKAAAAAAAAAATLSQEATALPPSAGFASLEEAVARIEGSKTGDGGNGKSPIPAVQQQQQINDTTENKSAPAHAGEEANPLPNSDAVNGIADHYNQTPTGEVSKIRKKALNGEKEKQKQRHQQTSKTSSSQQEASGVELSDVDTDAKPGEILMLDMHQSEVFMCAWNNVYPDLIATGSGDASARIWQMGGGTAAGGLTTVKLLPHGSDPRDRKNKDVTTLEWSSDGTLLATGSYDGVARVWARNGALIHTLRGHNGPIFSLKWNKKGNFLLSGSYDKTTIAWDVSGSTGFVEQQFTDHEAPALDVDWKDNTTFASCSTDKTVHICRVGVSRPLKVFTGHRDEVNAVKWDPSGTLLASCSDDCTAKVWDVESDNSEPMHDFKSHQQEIYTVKWSPTGQGSPNPAKRSMLATASFDGSVRLWNISDGSCYRVFNRHRDSVYSVAFSPSGDFLASGSLAGQMYIWNIEEGKHVKSYKGKGDIFEVAWNKQETRVAACFSSNVVAIIDFDRNKSI